MWNTFIMVKLCWSGKEHIYIHTYPSDENDRLNPKRTIALFLIKVIFYKVAWYSSVSWDGAGRARIYVWERGQKIYIKSVFYDILFGKSKNTNVKWKLRCIVFELSRRERVYIRSFWFHLFPPRVIWTSVVTYSLHDIC